MKRRISLLLLLFLLLSITILTGCWNYVDVDKLSLVSGFAIDKNEQENMYLLTAEVIAFEMSGKEAKNTPKLIQSQGNTIFDAIRNVLTVTGKRLYFSHSNTVIINQDIAKEGIIPVIDMLFRDAELREEAYVVISKEKTANELLKKQTITTEIHTNEIFNMLNIQKKSLSKAPVLQIYEIVNIIKGDGISLALPAMGVTVNSGKELLELKGTAVFKSDKLVGYLDTDESKYYLFVTNKVKRGLLIQNENPENQMINISLEILKTKTKIKPQYANERLVMNIDVKSEVAIGENETSIDFSKEENRDKLKKDAEASLKKSIEDVIKKVQNDYSADIFGFGAIVKANMPSVWKEINPNWDDIFKNLDVNVNVDITIRNSGLVSKAIENGD